jgi:hypothetical protein
MKTFTFNESRRIEKMMLCKRPTALIILACTMLVACTAANSDDRHNADNSETTVALWLFDEPLGLYASSTLDDNSENDLVMTIGMGAQIADGRFGRGLSMVDRERIEIPEGEENFEKYGFVRMQAPEGRNVEPLTWFNADFAALMTSGENHLRKEVNYKNPTKSGINIGDSDWTVEFWYSTDGVEADGESVVFELGSGPRGENDIVTRLEWSADRSAFTLFNQASGTRLQIPTVTIPAHSN